MAEKAMVFGAGTRQGKDGKSYGWLAIGIETDKPGNYKTAEINALAGVERGFAGPGEYQIDGDYRFGLGYDKRTIIQLLPNMIRKIEAK